MTQDTNTLSVKPSKLSKQYFSALFSNRNGKIRIADIGEAVTKASRKWNLEEIHNNRRRILHKRTPLNILKGIRDNTLTAFMKEQQGAMNRT